MSVLKLANNVWPKLTVRVGLICLLTMIICIYFLPIVAGSLQLPIEAQRQILRIVFLNALLCLYVSWVVEPVAQGDRKFMIVSRHAPFR